MIPAWVFFNHCFSYRDHFVYDITFSLGQPTVHLKSHYFIPYANIHSTIYLTFALFMYDGQF